MELHFYEKNWDFSFFSSLSLQNNAPSQPPLCAFYPQFFRIYATKSYDVLRSIDNTGHMHHDPRRRKI
jgi:hypothetical protein